MNSQTSEKIDNIFKNLEQIPEDGGPFSDLKSCVKEILELIETEIQVSL